MFSTKENTLLEVVDLFVKFDGSAKDSFAVNNLSFKIDKSESLGIVGESGSGKSVTMLSILGLLNNLEKNYPKGEVNFYGDQGKTNLLNLPESKLRNIRGKGISIIFQEPMTSFNPVKKIGEQVSEILSIHEQLNAAIAKEKTIEFFNEVQLPKPIEIFDRYPHELSGGQKQRAMIAMAIACKPKLLIADEPTTALDVTVQKEIINLLNKLREKYQMGLVFISHDLALVGECTHNLMVMYKGNLMEYGSTQKLLSNPDSNYTKALLKCRPSLNLEQKRLPIISDFIESEKKANGNIQALSDFKFSVQEQKDSLLNVEDISIHYPGKSSLFGGKKQSISVVSNVWFDLNKGQTLCIVGESGSGKTTVAKSIIGVLPINSGRITLLDKQFIGPITLPYNSAVQLVFQDPYASLNPVLKVGSCILEAIKYNSILESEKQQKEYAYWLLNRVGFDDTAFEKFPHQFSGGQRQRVVIARALACKPQLLICDEAVAALDVSVQAQVLNLLKDLQVDFGFANLFITHDLNVAKFISEKVLVMQFGKMVEYGNTSEVLNHPKEAYTKKLLDAVPVL